MLQKTKTPETTLFESPSNLLRGRALKKYDDPKAWQNEFYELVTRNVDKEVFSPLFKDGNMGRYSRYRIILSTLQQWAKAGGLGKLNPSLRKKVQPYVDEDAQKTEYRSTSDEMQKRIEAIPKKELDRRNNVEAAMFQISYHTRNNKTRYRGLGKHLM